MFRHPRHGRVAAPDAFAPAEELWHDLLRRGTRQPGFRLVRAGQTVAAREVTRRAGIGNHDIGDLVDANRVIERYRQGDTVVLQGLQHTDPALARLANNLALALDHPVQVNAYLSPASSRGLDLHFDYHDVFVVQLGGTKRWRAWPPLARTVNPVKTRPGIAAPRLAELGEPCLDLTMRAGDCLYLPRGFPHAAETVDDASDHLTIGLTAVTWQRVVRKVIDAEVAAGRLGAPLPVGLLEPGAAVPGDGIDRDLAGRWLEPAPLRHWLAREIWRRQPATRLRPLRVPPLTGGPLAVTPGPLLWLTETGARAVLGLGDRTLDLPAEALGLLAGLLAHEGAFTPDQLDGLDDGSRDVVLRRLVAEGVLADAG